MQLNHMPSEFLRTLEQCLLRGTPSLSEELYRFGAKNGRLSKSTILRMWNGVRLEEFLPQEIKALADFLSTKFSIGEYKQYFIGVEELDRKQQYLLTISDEKRRRAEENLLRRVKTNMEDVFERDVCELSAPELIAGLSNMGYVSKRTAQNEISAIKHYLEWCAAEGYYAPANTEIQKVNVKDIGLKKNLYSALIPTPSFLREIIEVTKDPEWLNTDSVILCLYWMGLTPDEIYDLRISQIDLINGLVANQYFGTIKIPDELLGIFRNYSDNDIIYSDNYSRVADKTEYFIQRFVHPGEKIIGQRPHPSVVNTAITRFKKQYEEKSSKQVKFTVTNLIRSGACWRLYQREVAGESLDDEAFKYEGRIDTPDKLAQFKKMYEQYKEIFFGA